MHLLLKASASPTLNRKLTGIIPAKSLSLPFHNRSTIAPPLPSFCNDTILARRRLGAVHKLAIELLYKLVKFIP